MDIQREYYEVTQPQLQNSPMLHTNIKCLSPSFSLLCMVISLTIKLFVLFLDLVFSISLLSVQIGHLGQRQLLREDLHVVLAL